MVFRSVEGFRDTSSKDGRRRLRDFQAMVLHAQFAGLTSLQSPPLPTTSKQGSKFLSRPALLPSSSSLPFPRRTFNLFRPSFNFSGPIRRLSTFATAAAAAHSEPPLHKLSHERSIFLHILDEYPPGAPLKLAAGIGSQDLGEGLKDPERSSKEDCFESKVAKLECNADEMEDNGGKEEGQEFPTGTQQQEQSNSSKRSDPQEEGGLGFRVSSDSIKLANEVVPTSERLKGRESSTKEGFLDARSHSEAELKDRNLGDEEGKKESSTGTQFIPGRSSNVRDTVEFKVLRGPYSGFKSSIDKNWLVPDEEEEEEEAGGQFDNFGSETERFGGRRQRLKVGRQVFLTGEQDYKRWMPSSEGEENVHGILEELSRDEEISHTIGPAESGDSVQAANGDNQNSEEREGQEFELGEEEGTQLSVETAEAFGGETSQDLLVEFLKKRSGQWGNDGDIWFRRGLSRDDNSSDTPVFLNYQTHVSQQNMDISSNSSTNSSKESIREGLLYTSGEAASIQEHFSETPNSSRGDEKHHAPAGLAQEIMGIAKSLPLNASLETFLTPFCGEISTSDGNLVLKSLGEAHLTWPMLSFFQWMRVQDPSLLDSRSYCTIFTFLGKLGMADQALLQYRNMPEGPMFHCMQVYNSLLGALARSNRQNKIPPILQEMDDRNIERDPVTYSILITATKGGKERVDRVWSIFDDMLREGMKPSVSVYGSLIKAFCDEGHLKQALLVSLSMEKMGISPNAIIYNTLIDGHGKALQLEEAEGLLLEMKERGLHPTESTYNSLINGYGRSGQLDVAEELLLEMQKEGLKPNVFTYTSLISAYGKQRMSEKAVNVFLRMRKSGLIPTTHTYTALINAYAEGGWHEKAQRAFDDMVREGSKPTIETYTALVDGYRRSGNLEMVRYVWNTIKGDGCVLTKVAYRTIIDAFGKYGLYVEARDVVDEFRKRGMEPDTMTFNILLNAYARGGVCTKLPKVMLEMQAAGCEPDAFTYCTLIYAFIRVRDFTSAFKYESEMVEKGIMPEQKVYKKMKFILDAKYALKLENDKKADSGHDPEGQTRSRKNPQRAKRKFKRYLKHGPLRGSERTRALWKDKEKKQGHP